MSAAPELDAVVVGGGVAGLSCGVALADAGFRVRVAEAEALPGGNVRSERDGAFLLEHGPHTLMASADHVFALAERVGLAEELQATRPEAADRFIARGGRVHAMPTGAWSFLSTPLLSPGAKLALATEPLRRSRGVEGDTAETFFRRRFGAEAGRVLAGAFISGVYAGDPARLSAPAAFPLFWGFERAAGSMILGAVGHYRRRAAERRAAGIPPRKGLFSFRGGLGRLPGALAESLGEGFLPRSPARALTRESGGWAVHFDGGTLRARAVVLAVPPPAAAALLEGLDPEAASLVAGVPMAPVAVVQLGFPERQPAIPEGFGFLVPRGEGIRSLGVLFPARLFQGRAPGDGDLLVGFAGGSLDPEALALTDEALVDLVRSELRDLVGLSAAPALVRVRRHPTAIPQLVLGHLDRMAALAGRVSALEGLHLAGNWLTGVGLKDAVRSGLDAAQACGTRLARGATA